MVPIRHPLDVLVSHAFYIDKSMTDSGSFPDASGSNVVRNTIARERLSDVGWVQSVMSNVVKFMKTQLMSPYAYLPVKYEDFFDRPDHAIRRICEYLDFDCDRNDVSDLWSSVFNRPLNKAHQAHFNAPGVNKWKHFLRRDMVAEVANEDLAFVLDRYDYPFDFDAMDEVEIDGIKRDEEVVQSYRKWTRSHCANAESICIDGIDIEGRGEAVAFLRTVLEGDYLTRLRKAFRQCGQNA